MDPGPESRRRLERETPKHAIILQRADCSFHGTPLLFANHKRKVCSNSIRQYFNGGLSKSPGRFSTGSFGHDKSNQNWTRENNFVNPPFRLIPQVIELLKQQKAVATLITPHWPGQFWFQCLVSMSIAKPIMLRT